MKQKNNRQREYNYLLLLSLFSLILQGIVLLTNNYDEDSTLLMYEMGKFNYHPFFEKFITDGVPLVYLFHYLVENLFKNYLFIYKFIGFFSFLGSSLLTFCILRKFKFADEIAFFITLISMSLPNYYQWYNPIFSPYSLSYLFVLWGILLYMNYLQTKKVYLAGFSFFVLILSFMIASNLVFAYVFLFSLFLLNYTKTVTFINNVFIFIRKNYLISFLPLVYWFVNSYFFPVVGNYNKISPTFRGVTIRTLQSFYFSIKDILQPLYNFFSSTDLELKITVLLISIFFIVLVVWKTKKMIFSENTIKEKWFYVIYSLFMLFMAFFPFLMVRKLGHLRNTLIIIPLAILIFYSLSLIIPKYLKIVLYVTIFLFSLVVINSHFLRQVNFLYRQSVMLNLKEIKPQSDVLVFKNIHALFYEWNIMLKQTFPNENKLGFNIYEDWYYNNQAEYALMSPNELYLIPKELPDFNDKIFITVKYNDISKLKIFRNYLFMNANEFKLFLKSITNIDVNENYK